MKFFLSMKIREVMKQFTKKHLNLFVVDHVKSWKVYINDEEKHDGTPNELTTDSQLRIDNLQSSPGENVKVTVTATRTDGSVVHPLLNDYCRLSKHTNYSLTVKNKNTIFAKLFIQVESVLDGWDFFFSRTVTRAEYRIKARSDCKQCSGEWNIIVESKSGVSSR